MNYEFLVETYETERIKVVSVWSKFRDGDLCFRSREGDLPGTQLPRADDASMRQRGHLVSDHARHQCECATPCRSRRRGSSPSDVMQRIAGSGWQREKRATTDGRKQGRFLMCSDRGHGS